ncbi:MAG: immunoglobulin domain-containing protein [Verrucomicrobiota bacterium]
MMNATRAIPKSIIKSQGRWGRLWVVALLLSMLRTQAAPELMPLQPGVHSTTNIQQLREAWKHDQRAYPLGYIPAGARARAFNQIQQTKPRRPKGQPLSSGGPQWVNIGPAPIVNGQIAPAGPVTGRVLTIAVDPGNPARWLIGAAQGGVWETDDTGATWTPKTDAQASLAIGAVAFAPGNSQVVYVGTGEPNYGSQDAYAGAGMLKSTDGGSTWQLLGGALFQGQSFSSIIVNPASADLLLASTTGGLAGRGAEAPPATSAMGVFKSTDGGTTWVLELTGFSTDLKADPGNFNHQAAAASPDGNTAFGLYQSLDAGDDWTAINGPWNNLGGVGRMQLALAPSSPATLYVSVTDVGNPQSNTNYNRLLGIWRTDNAWSATPAWTRLPQPPGVGEQLWYDHVIGVDPANANTLYFGETPLWKYNGTTWQIIGADYDANVNGRFFHPYQHALAWAGTRLILGNDGGVWSTTDGGITFNNHNSNLAITQFYYGAAHPQTRSFAVGGSQDNGSEKWGGTNGWTIAGLGDGGEAAISPNDPDNKWVVSLDKVQIVRTTGAGQFSDEVFAAGQFNLPNIPFIGRLALAPTNEDVLITATSLLIKSTDFFSAANPDFYQDSPDLNSTITALAFAPSDLSGSTYAFCTLDGQLQLTTTGNGYDAVNLNAGNGVPGRYITDVAFQPNDPNTLYVTLSGFDEGTPGKPGHVFKTANALSGNPNWVNISPPVDLPHNSIAVDPADPNTVYVGTDIGVWQTKDGGSTWTHMGPETGMPNVAVFDLKIQAATGRVFAFTHGRSAFMLDRNAPSQPPTISSFVPTNGPPGTSVSIIGTKFDNATSVQFAAVNAASFSVSSSTQIVATVPAGAVTGPITVATPGGAATSAASFIVSTAPAITGFTPISGSVGTAVTITGANLTGTTAVSFGAIAAATFTVDSPTQITATVPAGATTGKISVTTPTGTAQSGGPFTVTTAPVITGFSPASGPIGSIVTVTGANFVAVSRVAFNGVQAPSPVVQSSSQLTAAVPAGASTGPISITTATGTTQSGSSFTVIAAPAITTFSPQTGGPGTVVAIVGANFGGASAVTFNGVSASSFYVAAATQITATAPAGVSTGPIAVTTPGGVATSPASFNATTAPGNDNFAAAQAISGVSGTVSGDNTAATKEPGEPSHAGNDGGKSVWYRWTAPSPGTWTFNTQGSSFDTLLAVYTGSTLNNLVPVAGNDNIPGTNTSSVSFTATAGTIYQIAVDGFQADTGEESAPPPPASGAITLNWRLSADLIPQIASFSPPSGSVQSAVVIAGVNFLGVSGVTFNNASAAFTADSDLQITATVPSGATTGPIRVIKPSGTAMSQTSFVVGTGPGNDNFANAQVIAGNAGTIIGQNIGASKEPGEPDHAGDPGGSSVWYVWNAPSTGTWRFDTTGSSFDTLLAVYTGASVGALSLVVSNDDSGGALTSEVQFNALPGTSYRIAVDGYGGAVGNIVLNWAFTGNLPAITGFQPASGGPGANVTIAGKNLAGATAIQFGGVAAPAFTLNTSTQIVATVPDGAITGPIGVKTPNGSAQSVDNFVVTGNQPSNDNFAQAITIVGAVATVTGSNVGATKEPNEPNHAGNTGGSSVWWTWTAPTNGTYTITTRGSDFDTLLAVYSGSSLATLFTVAADDDGPNMGTASLATFDALAGNQYRIAVDGYDGAVGNIVLTVYPATPAAAIYFTGFENLEGYGTAFPLSGQNGWLSSGPGQNGIVYDYFYDYSQQAYVGYFSTVPGANTFVWQPLDYTPDTSTLPVVVFSTYMEIVDSKNFQYDDFGWDFYNQNEDQLFFLDFDNYNLGIYYLPNDGSGYQDTGFTFQNNQIYYLEVTMDFARNLWAAALDGVSIVQGQPISATNNVGLDLGDIDAAWLQTSGTFGDNYMLFDDYFVEAQGSQAPRIVTAPQPQSVTVGNNASFLVVVASPLPVAYQWQFDGATIPGATAATLTLNNLAFGQAGNYSVVVSNAAGVVIAGPAALAVSGLPNLVPYQPAGWSDKIVAATLTGSTNDATQINSDQDIYISWAVLNSATNADIAVRFYTQLYVDGTLNDTWNTDGLKSRFYTYVTDYDVGKLPVGTHTLRLDTDTTGVVSESNENDNSYTKTIVVSSTNNAPPQLVSDFGVTGGQFHLTLMGIPLRTYEIQASTNLTDWSVLATLVNSNTSGLLQYSDPLPAKNNRRFYRSHLLGP